MARIIIMITLAEYQFYDTCKTDEVKVRNIFTELNILQNHL